MKPIKATAAAGAIACAAFAASVWFAVQDADRIRSADEEAFHDLAGNLAAHGRFAHTNLPGIEGYDPALPRGALRPTAYRAPGFALFLAPLRAAGLELAGLRIANCALFALTFALLFVLVSRHTGSQGAGLSGMGLALAYPVLFYAAGTLYPQTLAGLLLVALVLIADGNPSLRRSALAGTLCAAAVLAVPVFLALLPIVALWLRVARRAGPTAIAALAAPVALAAAVWMARNDAELGAPVLSTNSGFNLLAGIGPSAEPGHSLADLKWPPGVREEVEGAGELERDRILRTAAIRFARLHPREAAILYARRLAGWFAFRNVLASDAVVQGGAGAGPPALRDTILAFSYGLLLILALIRMLSWRWIAPDPLEWLCIALYLGGGFAYALFFTRIRFRLPFDWLLIALDTIFLARVASRAASLAGNIPRSKAA